jgi:hypothetical protein
VALKIDVAMPENMDIGDGWAIEWAAVSPTDGSAVSGVTISNASVTATDLSGGTASFESGPFMLVPGPGA